MIILYKEKKMILSVHNENTRIVLSFAAAVLIHFAVFKLSGPVIISKNELDRGYIASNVTLESFHEDNDDIDKTEDYTAEKNLTKNELNTDSREKSPGGGSIDDFRSEIVKKIVENRYYPAEAMDRGIYGDVRLSFTLGHDGSLIDIRIIDSPHPILSIAVEDAVRRSAPFPGLPVDGNMEFILVLSFTLDE